ncbi:MAG: response regulator [Proteobacteria bacterium]|nr:response regulator [Pseudomonadota bacterium]
MHSILLVDDEPMILRVMRVALEKVGYRVITAVDGKDALDKLEASHPDILVTDIEMPRMTGKELCLEIQKTIIDRQFPIFISTSLTAMEHREWSRKIPNLIFLEKPISIRKLRSAISEFVTEESMVNS